MSRTFAGFVVVALLAVGLVATPANAGSVLPKGPAIDFGSISEPGNVQHSGGMVNFTEGFGNAFTVVNAPIYQLRAPVGSHGPSKNGLYAVTSGALNITTGPCISGCVGISKTGFQGVDFSGTGSSLTLTGAIAGLGITSPEMLIEGVFDNLGSSNPATHVSLNKGTNPKHPGTGGMTGYLDITYINPLIVEMLHLQGSIGEGRISEMYFNLNFMSGSKSWTGPILSSDLNVVPTPEPTNLMLLGTALLAAAWITRRKVRA